MADPDTTLRPDRLYPSWVEVRFYAELNDYLPTALRKRSVRAALDGPRTLGRLIEGLGVPVADVDLVLVDECPAAFDHLLRGGERVAAYPVFERFDVAEITSRERPLRSLRFVTTLREAGLARRLRELGYDVRCVTVRRPQSGAATEGDRAPRGNIEDETEALIATSNADQRIILTRDGRLRQDGRVERALWLRSGDPEQQLAQVLCELQLAAAAGGPASLS